MELTQLRAFIAVAHSGGFAPAAHALDVAPSTITRAVANLEASLGVRLFQRTTRSVTLTDVGESFLARITPALDEIDGAADFASSGEAAPSGVLRVSASVSFGQNVIAPKLKTFCDQYQDLNVELILSDAVADLISERIDIAVRHGSLDDSSLIAQRLTDVRYRLVASPDYLQIAGVPSHPKDLVDHACLTFTYPAFRSRWLFKKRGRIFPIEINPTTRISNAAALATCVKDGMGLALLADWMADRDLADGSLLHVLPSWTPSGIDNDDAALWIVTPSRQFVPRKTRVFIEFIRSAVAV
jgi:DNA-binding transcriptional LysR family regulator